MSTSEQATLVVFGDAEVEQSLKAGATLTLQVDPPATDEHIHSLSKDRQTGGTSPVQHIQDTFQQSSVSFKNQIQDADTEIIENAPVWLSLCGLDFFSVPHGVRDIFPLVLQANEDAPVESVSLQPVDSTSVSQTSLTFPSTPSKVLRSQACQANSPQIKTDSQVKRNEHSLKKRLFSAIDTLEKDKCKVYNVQAKKVAVAKENCEKRRTLTDLRQTNKQLNQALKKTQSELKSMTRTDSKQDRKAEINMADLDHLAEENELLKQTSDKLDSKLQEEKALRRKVEKKLSKSKSRTEHFQSSLLQLCRNSSSNQNTEESVEELITQLFERDVQSANLLRSLASAVSKPVATKSTSGIYNDNLALLTMELVNMGVSQEAVGKVMKACTTHLAGRTLDSVVSRRTAGRMIRRGGILSDAQVAMELESNASRGVRVGQDTTTRRGTEHVSTVWGVRKEDGSVRYLQSRVQWLPNHTADVQTEHILQQMHKGRELLEKLNLQSQQAMSIVHIVEFIGGHVNNKLHRHLQDHHMTELSHLIESEEIDLATQATLSSLYKSACQQHSCAKVSRSFFEGMQEKEPANFGAAFGRFGLKQKKGRTYEAASAKVIEFASSQFSPDYANTVSIDFNWADVFCGWCEANNRTYHHIGYVNKNRHYRHEKEAFTILMLKSGRVSYKCQFPAYDSQCIFQNSLNIYVHSLSLCSNTHKKG